MSLSRTEIFPEIEIRAGDSVAIDMLVGSGWISVRLADSSDFAQTSHRIGERSKA
jgi:hypothetical protein